MIYIHIGLHKTATTSLQKDVFPFVSGKRYIGRSFPLSQLYLDICEYCYSVNTKDDLKERVRSDILSALEEEDLILSDEWFTADYSGFYGFEGASWQVKLDRLKDLVSGLDHKILVTLRDPLEGLYSQYCEFVAINLGDLYPSFISYAIESNDAKAYDYEKLNSILGRAYSDVTYIRFSDFKSDVGLEKLCRFLEVKRINQLGHHNVKEKNNEGTLVRVRSSYLRDAKKLVPMVFKKKVRESPLLTGIKRKFVFMLSREHVIPYPKPLEVERLKERFSSSLYFFDKI